MNNPILLILILFQICVAISYFVRGGILLGLLFIIYAVANVVTIFIEVQ
jgi:hypothetical protein